MKISKAFAGVVAGEVYPREFQPGEECPPELEEAARSLDALEVPAPPLPPPPPPVVPQLALEPAAPSVEPAPIEESSTVQTPEQQAAKTARRAPSDKAHATAPEKK